MLSLGLPSRGARPLRVLALGCHADDVEIGCGGTLLRLLEEAPGTEVTWVVFSAHGDRREEARLSAEEVLVGAGRSDVRLHAFRDGYFPWQGAEVKDVFEAMKAEVDPDLVLTHRRDDLHQDHRLVCQLTWNTFRNHLVLEYEIPKYDGDMGQPNAYVPIDEPTARRKVDVLTRHFQTQANKHWFTPDLFWGLMRLRGMESNAPSGFAEAFHGRKLVL